MYIGLKTKLPVALTDGATMIGVARFFLCQYLKGAPAFFFSQAPQLHAYLTPSSKNPTAYYRSTTKFIAKPNDIEYPSVSSSLAQKLLPPLR